MLFSVSNTSGLVCTELTCSVALLSIGKEQKTTH